jgi:hypothetical protein
MKRLLWALPLLLLLGTGCGFHANGNVNQIQLAAYNQLCVDVLDASMAPGAQVQIYPCGAGKKSQEWSLVPVDSNGNVNLVNENSQLCMTVADTPDTAPGQLVIQEPCGGGDSEPEQVWSIVPAPGQPGNRFVSMASSQCLDLPYGAIASLYPLQQYYCTQDDPAQGWLLNKVLLGNTP